MTISGRPDVRQLRPSLPRTVPRSLGPRNYQLVSPIRLSLWPCRPPYRLIWGQIYASRHPCRPLVQKFENRRSHRIDVCYRVIRRSLDAIEFLAGRLNEVRFFRYVRKDSLRKNRESRYPFEDPIIGRLSVSVLLYPKAIDALRNASLYEIVSDLNQKLAAFNVDIRGFVCECREDTPKLCMSINRLHRRGSTPCNQPGRHAGSRVLLCVLPRCEDG